MDTILIAVPEIDGNEEISTAFSSNNLQTEVEGNTNGVNPSSSSLSGPLPKMDVESPSTKKGTEQQPSASSVSFYSEGNARIKELKEQIDKLSQLLILKEQEWSTILRLKKYMEYALEQVERIQRKAKEQNKMTEALTTTEIEDCVELVISQKDKFSWAEIQMQKYIESIEDEKELLKTKLPFQWKGGLEKTATNGESGGESEPVAPTTVPVAVQTERKRKAHVSPSIKISARSRIINRHTASTAPKKGITNMDVRTLNMGPGFQYTSMFQQLLDEAAATAYKNAAGRVAASSGPAGNLAFGSSISKKPGNRKPTSTTGRSPTTISNPLLISDPESKIRVSGASTVSLSNHSGVTSSIRSQNDTPVTASKVFFGKFPPSPSSQSSPPVNEDNNMPQKENENVQEEDAENTDQFSVAKEGFKICQGCNQNAASFMCGACKRQWYCSRECQSAAWDEHSETCPG